MDTRMLKRARNNFYYLNNQPDLQRQMIRKWVGSMRILGDKWLLSKPVERKTTLGV